jgi:hypothetical protein
MQLIDLRFNGVYTTTMLSCQKESTLESSMLRQWFRDVGADILSTKNSFTKIVTKQFLRHSTISKKFKKK